MQRMVLMLCVGVLMAFVVPLATFAQSWIQYRPAGGGYQIEMPDTPFVQTEDLKIAGGRTVTQTRAIVDKRRTAYIMAYLDYPDDVIREASPDTILKRLRDGMAQTSRVRRDVALTVSGAPGRELIGIDKNGLQFVMRAALSGNRLFQIMVAGPDGIEAQPDTMRFLESFSLVN
jgi:hypothetical protein